MKSVNGFIKFYQHRSVTGNLAKYRFGNAIIGPINTIYWLTIYELLTENTFIL